MKELIIIAISVTAFLIYIYLPVIIRKLRTPTKKKDVGCRYTELAKKQAELERSKPSYRLPSSIQDILKLHNKQSEEMEEYRRSRDHWNPFCMYVWLRDKSVNKEDKKEFILGVYPYISISSKEYIENMDGIEMYDAHHPKVLMEFRK